MDIELVNKSTQFMMDNGQFILQAHRFADNDSDHASRLLRWAELPENARVIDLGSGTGAVDLCWSIERPDLQFCLVNLSEFQLGVIPKWCDQICCDMEDVPCPDESFDAAVCLFTIGHGDTREVIREMSRLVRPGGVVFVYSMVGDNKNISSLSYEIVDRDYIEMCAKDVGLIHDFYMEPQDRGSWASSNIDGYSDYFGGLRPAIWRWTKGA
jgi:ubiquinone/menaquinone biosynthesis C-methylase UbiE